MFFERCTNGSALKATVYINKAMATRPDSATISFTVNLPPEVIQAYFEGAAKVEQSKRTFPNFSLPSFSIFAPLIPMAVELAKPYVSSFNDSVKEAVAKNETTVKKPDDVESKSVLDSASSESEPAVDDHDEPEEDSEPIKAHIEPPPKHRPAYDEDADVPVSTGVASTEAAAPAAMQMPDMAGLMENVGPMMQQMASLFGGGVPQAPKGHKHTPTKKPSKKPGVKTPVKPIIKPKAKAKAAGTPSPAEVPPTPQPAEAADKPSPSVEALNNRLEALISSELPE
jgi:hypothetical protein